MSLHSTTGRIIVYAWKHSVRNAWMGLATVMVLVLAFLSVNVLVGLQALMQNAVTSLEQRVDVSVYFKPTTSDAVLRQTAFFFASLPQVQSADLHTPEESLKAFRERHVSDVTVIEALGELDQNPLGASLVLKAKRADDYPFLLETLKSPQIAALIESQTYDDHAEAIANVRKVAAAVRLVGVVLVAIFVLFSMLIVTNAVRVATYTHREEIGIMRLVGASSSFVRLPFVLEGLFLVAVAVVFTAAIMAGSLTLLEPALQQAFGGADPGIRGYFLQHWLVLAAAEGIGMGLLVSVVSWVAVGRHVKN